MKMAGLPREMAELPNQMVRLFLFSHPGGRVMTRGRQGAVLSVVLITSIVFAMTAYAALVIALARVRMMPVTLRQVQARYAAEGGLAWAMQRLFRDPSWTSGVGYNPPHDDPPPTLTNGLPVDIIMLRCEQSPCERRTLQAKVVY